MNKKSFAFLSFFLVFLFVFLGSFYGWVVSQFNEEKFEEKLTHYFNKNFPLHSIEVGSVDFRFTNKIQYHITDLLIRENNKGNVLLKIPDLLFDIPIGAFLGGREVRIKTLGLNVFFDEQKDLKELFFPMIDKNEDVHIDLPKLINNNQVSFSGTRTRVTIAQTGSSYVFKRIFFKNLNMTHYTAFEIEGPLSDLGTYRSYGEIDLGDFFKTRGVKLEGYLSLSDLRVPFSAVNGVTFKVLSLDKKNGYHLNLKSTTASLQGESELLIKKDGIDFKFLNMVAEDSTVLNFFHLQKWLTCEKAGKVNIEGGGRYNYKEDVFFPNVSVLGDCFSFEAHTSQKYKGKIEWNVKKSNEEGFSVDAITEGFSLKLSGVEKVDFIKNYTDFNKIYDFSKVKVFLSSFLKDFEQEFYFPFSLSINQVHHNKEMFKLSSKGMLSSDNIAIDNISFKNVKDPERSFAKMKFSFKEDLSYVFSADVRNIPAVMFSLFLFPEKTIQLTGKIEKGSYIDNFSVDNNEKLFDFKVRDGSFEWMRIQEALNKEILSENLKEDLREQLLWSSEFDLFSASGKYKQGVLTVDYKFNPKGEFLSRSGQMSSNWTQKIHNLDFLYINPSRKVKNYLLKNFESTQVVFKLENSETFKVVK